MVKLDYKFKVASEYRKIAISLIAYIPRLIENKLHFKNIEYQITIKENNLILTLSSDKEIVSRAKEIIELYAEILLGKIPVTKLLSDEKHIMELKQNLDVAAMEIKITQDMLEENNQEFSEKVKMIFAQIAEGFLVKEIEIA